MSNLKQFLSRLFSPGKIPAETKAQLKEEGLLLLQEKVWTTVIFRNFKAKGRRHSFRQSLTLGSFALSELRVVGLSFTKTLINVPYNYPGFPSISFEVRKNKYLCSSFDVSKFNPGESGEVELRFKLSDPDKAMEIISSKKAS